MKRDSAGLEITISNRNYRGEAVHCDTDGNRTEEKS